MIVPQFSLEWMDPPSPSQQAYDPILRELKARPGKWARVMKDRSGTAGQAGWQKQGCETKAHRTNPGEKPPKYDIYVRWPELKSEPRPIRDAAAKGVAHTPPPALPQPKVTPIDHAKVERASREAEAFAAARAARGVGPDGKPLSSLQH